MDGFRDVTHKFRVRQRCLFLAGQSLLRIRLDSRKKIDSVANILKHRTVSHKQSTCWNESLPNVNSDGFLSIAAAIQKSGAFQGKRGA